MKKAPRSANLAFPYCAWFVTVMTFYHTRDTHCASVDFVPPFMIFILKVLPSTYFYPESWFPKEKYISGMYLTSPAAYFSSASGDGWKSSSYFFYTEFVFFWTYMYEYRSYCSWWNPSAPHLAYAGDRIHFLLVGVQNFFKFGFQWAMTLAVTISAILSSM